MGQQLEEEFLALSLEEGAGLIKLPPHQGKSNYFKASYEKSKWTNISIDYCLTSKSTCEHIPWLLVGADEMEDRLLRGLQVPVGPTSSFPPLERKMWSITVLRDVCIIASYISVKHEYYLGLMSATAHTSACASFTKLQVDSIQNAALFILL